MRATGSRLSAGSWPVRKGNQSVYAMVDRLYTPRRHLWDAHHKRLTASNDPGGGRVSSTALLAVVVASSSPPAPRRSSPRSPAVTVELAIVLCSRCCSRRSPGSTTSCFSCSASSCSGARLRRGVRALARPHVDASPGCSGLSYVSRRSRCGAWSVRSLADARDHVGGDPGSAGRTGRLALPPRVSRRPSVRARRARRPRGS